jgi:hypothetical protein
MVNELEFYHMLHIYLGRLIVDFVFTETLHYHELRKEIYTRITDYVQFWTRNGSLYQCYVLHMYCLKFV